MPNNDSLKIIRKMIRKFFSSCVENEKFVERKSSLWNFCHVFKIAVVVFKRKTSRKREIDFLLISLFHSRMLKSCCVMLMDSIPLSIWLSIFSGLEMKLVSILRKLLQRRDFLGNWENFNEKESFGEYEKEIKRDKKNLRE